MMQELGGWSLEAYWAPQVMQVKHGMSSEVLVIESPKTIPLS